MKALGRTVITGPHGYTHGVKHWWDIKVITYGKIGRATAEEAAHQDLLVVLHILCDPRSIDDYGCIKTPSNRLPIMGICTGLTFIYVFYSLVGNSVITKASESTLWIPYYAGTTCSEILSLSEFFTPFSNTVRLGFEKWVNPRGRLRFVPLLKSHNVY